MENLRLRALFTDQLDGPDDFTPEAGCVYLHSAGEEERSQHVLSMQQRAPQCRFLRLVEVSEYALRVDGQSEEVALRNRSALVELLKSTGATRIYLDMTGMSHSMWAPIVRVAIEEKYQISVIYLEPKIYAYSKSPREGEFFELTESKRGMGPLPQFASLRRVPAADVCLIPLLGFEGARLRYVIEQVQPKNERIVPVLGLPGFRPEYPFHTAYANGSALKDSEAHRDIKFARANCPFSCFYVLTDIFSERPNQYFKVATIGTKPHALGAVLRAIVDPGTHMELVYDHIRRKPKRTTGIDHCLVYDISGFVDALGAR